MSFVAARSSESSPTELPPQQQLATLVEAALSEAKARGASSAEAAVRYSSGLSVGVRLGELETLERHRNRSLAVTVYFGQHKGSASTSDWQADAIRDTVEAACSIARHTASDNYAGLADPARLANNPPDLQLHHPWTLTTEAAIELARQCETLARDYDPRISNSEGGHLSSAASLMFYANSDGFNGGYPSTRHAINCSVIAQDSGGMQRGYWFTTARDPSELEVAAAVGKRAGERAIARLGARQLTTREAPVLFIPELARGLFGHLVAAVSGTALYRKTSFLLDHSGRKIFPEKITLREQPHLPKALGSIPFDAEGVTTQTRNLVCNGVLQGYVLDSYSARRLGLESTGNAGGVHNLSIDPGPQDFEQLLQIMDRGLVVTQLMGQGVNLLTGDYSRGATGFWVEHGTIQYPVEEITIASNLRDMFLNIQAVGRDIDTRGVIRCGSILIERMTIAGK